MLIVQKFGGSSVGNTERIFNVASIVTDAYKKGNDVVVVLSAQADTTDDLIAKAKEINLNPSKREMDMLLATGEQASVALMAMAIEKLGCPVISLTGYQAGFITNSTYSSARIKSIHTERIEAELDKKRIVIVAGFQGFNQFEDITTLGRGGSDTSAVALAAALHANLCQIYTDVNGVYTADPRFVKSAQKLDEITYEEMLELASLGAGVLHNRSVEMGKKYNVEIEVLSSFTKEPGTIVKEDAKMEKMLIRGVTKDDDVARVAVIGLQDTPGTAFSVFSLLAKNKINVDVILQSVGRDNTKDISFTVAADHLEATLNILNGAKATLGCKEVTSEENISKVSMVGCGMVNNPGVAAGMFEALYEVGVNIKMISTSEIKVSVLIDEKDSKKAVVAIHDKFLLP